MTYNIPDALAPYLEYIPEDMLAEIITEALEEKIFNKKEVTSSAAVTPNVDFNQLLEQIQGMLGSAAPKQLSNEVSKQVKKEDTTPIMITSPVSEDVDEDLVGLVEDFTANLFK